MKWITLESLIVFYSLDKSPVVMLHRKLKFFATFILLVLCTATAFATSEGRYQEFRGRGHGRGLCAKAENKAKCRQALRREQDGPQRRKHIRRLIMQKNGYKFRERERRGYHHPVTRPYAGSIPRNRAGRLTPDQRRKLRRMINEVNQDSRYQRSR